MNKRGVTLIEILVLFLLLFLGVTGALIGGAWFGVLGYLTYPLLRYHLLC